VWVSEDSLRAIFSALSRATEQSVAFFVLGRKMQRALRDYIENAELASNPTQLRDVVEQVIRPFDFNAFAFLALPDSGDAPLLISNYDERWQDHYVARSYQKRDPVMLHSRSAITQFTWSREMASRFGPLAEDFFCEAESFNIRSGITIPIPDWRGGFAAMTFATDLRRARLETCLRCNGAALLFLTAHVHSQLRRMLEPLLLIEGVVLTPREHMCLRWAAEGKSQSDIVQITGISARSVARAIESLRAKFGVRTTAQAVAIYAAYKVAKRGKVH